MACVYSRQFGITIPKFIELFKLGQLNEISRSTINPNRPKQGIIKSDVDISLMAEFSNGTVDDMINRLISLGLPSLRTLVDILRKKNKRVSKDGSELDLEVDADYDLELFPDESNRINLRLVNNKTQDIVKDYKSIDTKMDSVINALAKAQ